MLFRSKGRNCSIELWSDSVPQRWKTQQIEKFSQLRFPSHTHLLLLHRLFRLHWFLSFRYLHSLYWGGTWYTENAVNVDSNFHFDLCTLSRLLGNHILNQELACKSDIDISKASIEKDHPNNILSVKRDYICYKCIKELVDFAVPIQMLGYGSSFRLL